MADLPGVHEVIRREIAATLMAKDQDLLDRCVVEITLAGCGDIVEKTLLEELAKAPPDVQEFWGAPCNCHGMWN